jgi:hypothetical protein
MHVQPRCVEQHSPCADNAYEHGRMTEYQRRLIETLVRAKHAPTDEERARLFKTAEEWSARAREAEEPGCDDGILAEAALWHGIVGRSVTKRSC